MKLSIVTTLYRSAEYVEEFHRRISIEAGKITDDYEIVMVDDGSPDAALESALRLLEQDKHLKVIELSRNFGHHKALMTGIAAARGELVFLIDVDLEEPPELLSEFLRVMQRGSWDVVYGCQQRRKGDLVQRYFGELAWQFMNFCLPVKLPRNHSTVRLMKREYVQALVLHREHKTAIGGLWVMTGFRQEGVAFMKGWRKTSSYTFNSRLIMLLDSITSFSELPLFAIFYIGTFMLFASCVGGAWLIGIRLSGKVLPGWASTMISIWFLGGLSIFCIGIVGLYVSRIFVETKHRPYTIIRKTHEKPD